MRRGLLLTAAAVLAACGTVLGRSDRWTPRRSATLARTEVAAARVGHKLYVVGGYAQRSRATTRAVERYDIDSDRWKRARPMPVGLNHAAAVAFRGKLYIHGGYRSTGAVSAGLYVYSPRRNRWRRLRSSPTPRAAEAAAVIGHRLYVAGGASTSGSLRSLEIYNFRTGRWREGPGFPGPARNHTTGAASRGRFYVIAGRDRGQNLRSVDRYDPRTGAWSRLPPLRTARGGIASARLPDGKIAVFGGEQQSEGNSTIGQVELLDPDRLSWSRLPSLRTPRHGLGGAALGRRLFAVEGGPRPGLTFSRALEILDVP